MVSRSSALTGGRSIVTRSVSSIFDVATVISLSPRLGRQCNDGRSLTGTAHCDGCADEPGIADARRTGGAHYRSALRVDAKRQFAATPAGPRFTLADRNRDRGLRLG